MNYVYYFAFFVACDHRIILRRILLFVACIKCKNTLHNLKNELCVLFCILRRMRSSHLRRIILFVACENAKILSINRQMNYVYYFAFFVACTFLSSFFPCSQRYDESKANRLIQNIKVTPTPLNTKNTSKTQILRSQPYHVPSNPRNPPLPRPQSIKSKILKF